MEPAQLFSAALMPTNASTWKKAVGGAQVSCRVCLDCGAIDQLKADPEQLRKMLPES
jgi:hypothetical protein